MNKLIVFLKGLSKIDILCLFITLTAIILFVTAPNYKNTYVEWIGLSVMIATQIFMITYMKKVETHVKELCN